MDFVIHHPRQIIAFRGFVQRRDDVQKLARNVP
jgi:hypothetical protein